MASTKSDWNRLWRKVKIGDECWEWKASKHRDGYGNFRFGGRMDLAHRAAWTLERGTIPNELQVLHTCDNRSCVRPSHLWLGTNADNVRDKMKKGRHQQTAGAANPNAKLTAKQVAWARKNGLTQQATADALGVTNALISKIRAGKLWKENDDAPAGT